MTNTKPAYDLGDPAFLLSMVVARMGGTLTIPKQWLLEFKPEEFAGVSMTGSPEGLTLSILPIGEYFDKREAAAHEMVDGLVALGLLNEEQAKGAREAISKLRKAHETARTLNAAEEVAAVGEAIEMFITRLKTAREHYQPGASA